MLTTADRCASVCAAAMGVTPCNFVQAVAKGKDDGVSDVGDNPWVKGPVYNLKAIKPSPG